MFLFRLAFGLVRFSIKLTLVLAFAGAIALVVYTFFWLPDVTSLVTQNPETTAFIERARSRYRRQEPTLKVTQQWVSLDKISKNLTKAVLLAEDDRFYQHKGFDLIEIRNSIMKNIRERRWARGGSTLTQQLAKNLYLSPEKTLKRKFDEMILTWKLESRLSKSRILELYLNVVEWGEGRFGAEAAAQFYFNKSALQLTCAEAASLAARLPNPDYLSSSSGADLRRQHEEKILEKMGKQKPPEVLEKYRPPAGQKPLPNPQGPLLPRTATLLPVISGPAAQVGNLFKDKVTQALLQLEKFGPKKLSEELPEEPPRAIPESPASPERMALISSSSSEATPKQMASTLKSAGPVEPSGEDNLPVSPKKSEVVAGVPATPRPIPPRESPSTAKVKPSPAPSTPRRSKQLRESLARLENALGK